MLNSLKSLLLFCFLLFFLRGALLIHQGQAKDVCFESAVLLNCCSLQTLAGSKLLLEYSQNSCTKGDSYSQFPASLAWCLSVPSPSVAIPTAELASRHECCCLKRESTVLKAHTHTHKNVQSNIHSFASRR